MFWIFGHKACEILAHQPGVKHESPALEGEVSTTRLPVKSLPKYLIQLCFLWPFFHNCCFPKLRKQPLHLKPLLQSNLNTGLCLQQNVCSDSDSESHSVVSDSATPLTIAHQAPESMGFSRQEYQSGSPFLSSGDLPNIGIETGSPSLQVDSSPYEPPGKPQHDYRFV